METPVKSYQPEYESVYEPEEEKINQEVRSVQRRGIPTPIKTDSKGRVVKFTNRTLFAFNKADLTPEAKEILRNVARIIKKYEDRIGRIQILGHTDTVGTIWYNRYLSRKRANSVKNFLISQGVDANSLDAFGLGEEQPRVYPERTEADRQANRRAEFFFKLLFKRK